MPDACLLHLPPPAACWLQIKNGVIQVMPMVGVPQRPIVGDGVNFPARWQPRIPDSGTMSTIPLPGPQ